MLATGRPRIMVAGRSKDLEEATKRLSEPEVCSIFAVRGLIRCVVRVRVFSGSFLK
jgi:hypothetical protein